MKLLKLLILIMLFSSCIFSKKADTSILLNDAVTETEESFIRDSIKVNVEIGDYNVFYKISEFEHPKDMSPIFDDKKKTAKTILLNIRKVDTTSVLAYKTMDIRDFTSVLNLNDKEEYFIESFHIKEVRPDSIIFNAKLCMFEKNLCKNIDLTVRDDGAMIYTVAG